MKTERQLTTREILDWDVISWSKALKYWDQRIPSDLSGLKALELGAYNAGLSAWLAQKNATVISSDVDELPPGAYVLQKKYNLTDRVQFKQVDATNMSFENEFDFIVFKSIAGGIGRNNHPEHQQTLFNQIHKALKPGGKLLFAENAKASPLHQFARKNFVSWGNSWQYVTHTDFKSFFKEYKSYDIHSSGFTAAFGRSEKQRNMLGKLDTYLFNNIVPKSWHYIIYGIAEK